MCSESSSILDGKGGENVGASVRRQNGLERSTVCKELPVHFLLCCVAWDRGYFLQDRFSIHCGHHRVDNQMHAVCEEVQGDHVPGSGDVRGAQAPRLGCVGLGNLRH